MVPGRFDRTDHKQPTLPDLPFCSRRRVCRHHTQVHHDDDGDDGGDDDGDDVDGDDDDDDDENDDNIDSG